MQLQERLGGDAEIGIKLFSLLKKAGFVNLQLSFADQVHHAGQPGFVDWMDNMIGNVESAVDQLVGFGFAEQEQIQSAINELEIFKNNETASVYFWWNRI